MSGAGSGPLTAVLDAFTAGAGTVDELVARTRLPRDVVDTALDHLVRLGRVDAQVMTFGCPTGGCGSCPAASGGGCGAGRPARGGERTGEAVMLTLLRRPPGA